MKKQEDKKTECIQKKAKKERLQNLVDEAGEDSFPASDPPPWTLGEKEQKK